MPNDPLIDRQWYLERIGAPVAWDVTTGSRTIVAVLDVGMDLDHPDLVPALWTNPDEIAGNGIDDDRNGYVDDVHGWDFIAGDADPSPAYDVPDADPRDLHHGTVVAGIIAARGNNNEGISGIDWGAQIMPLRVLHGDGTGEVDTVLPAFAYALAEGATIINLSFVGDERSPALDAAIADASRRGVLVVAAGGNEDRNGRGNLDEFPVYPICAGTNGEFVLGVTATNTRDEKATFSSYGTCVDIAAPGELISATLFQDAAHTIVPVGGRITTLTYAGAYGGPFSGTSFATPVATGVAALVRSVLPAVTPGELIALLRATADPIVNETAATAGKLGAGRVNLARAVTEARTRATLTPSASSTTVTLSAPLASIGERIALRVDARSASGAVLASRTVAIIANDPAVTVAPAPQATDGSGSATFTVTASRAGAFELQIAIDGTVIAHARVVFAAASTAPIGAGALLRGTSATVYAIGSDGKRYAFPDAQTYRSWYADDSGISRVPDDILSAFPLGGLVTIRPGTFLVKIQTDPKVYAVESGGWLRWVTDEPTATALYGTGWAKRVVDVSDAFFPTYHVGDAIVGAVHPTGSLLEDARDGSRYLIAVGQRRKIESTLAFLKNGYQWRDVIRVSAALYSDGSAITDREPALAQPVP